MNTGNKKLSGRRDTGFYALNKLASAGAILLLLTILSWFTPWDSDQVSLLSGISVPIEQSIYGYALIASLIADAILSLLPPVSRLKQAALYGAAGFLIFSLQAGKESDTFWISGAIGILLLLMYLWGKHAFSSQSLITPFFALIVPLLCWMIV